METHWLLLGASAVLLATGWGACHWWHRSRVATLIYRVNKLERARDATRQQIETLQRELLESRRALSLAAAQREKARRRETARRAAAVPTLDPSDALGLLPRPHGFEDTLPM